MATKALGPYVPLYCREILGDPDIASLEDDQFGRLVRYWLVLSEMSGRLPGDVQEIAKRSRTDVRKVKRDIAWFPTFFRYDAETNTWHSDRLERQALKYANKVESARKHGNSTNPELGGAPDPESDDYRGVDQTPEMGAAQDPDSEDIVRGTQTQTQIKEVPPLTPPQAEGKSRGKVRRSRGQEAKPDDFSDAGYDPEVAKVCTAVVNSTPKQDTDGRPIPLEVGKLATRVEGILRDHPKLDGDILIEAWLGYLKRKHRSLKAPHYYFGEEKHQSNGEGANWHPDVKLLWHMRCKAAREAAQAKALAESKPDEPGDKIA